MLSGVVKFSSVVDYISLSLTQNQFCRFSSSLSVLARSPSRSFVGIRRRVSHSMSSPFHASLKRKISFKEKKKKTAHMNTPPRTS